MNYPRRQQYRRLAHSGMASVGCAAMLVLAAALVNAGAASPAIGVLLLASGLAIYSRRLLGLARRSRVGARSEDEVRRALSVLEGRGWRVRHGLTWRGRGDIDSVAIAPSGVAFAIETKTSTYEPRHVARVHDQAAWLWRRRRRWCRNGVLPVLCVVCTRGSQRWEHDPRTPPPTPQTGCVFNRQRGVSFPPAPTGVIVAAALLVTLSVAAALSTPSSPE